MKLRLKGLKVLIAPMKKRTFFPSSLGRGDGDQRSRRQDVDTSVIYRCNRFITRVEDPRASRTSFPASHPAVVYRVVPYDFLVMTTSVDDLHFFQTKKSRARIRPICPEGLCREGLCSQSTRILWVFFV